MPTFDIADQDADLMETFEGRVSETSRLPRGMREAYARAWLRSQGPPRISPSRPEAIRAWWRNEVQFVAIEPTDRGYRVVLYHKGNPAQTTGYFDNPFSAIKVAERCYGTASTGQPPIGE